MTAVKYMNTFGKWPSDNYTEDVALEQLIRSHGDIRKARLDYGNEWRNLPSWKRWIIRKLGFTGMY